MAGESSRRHRTRSRERTKDRRRDRSRSRERHGDRDRNRERSRHSDRHARDHSPRRDYDREPKGTVFSSAGRIFDDNGGLPLLDDPYQGHNQRDANGSYASYSAAGPHQDRARAYGEQLEAGLGEGASRGQDDDARYDGYSRGTSRGREDDARYDGYSRGRGGRAEPSNTLYVKGVPLERDENDLNGLLAGWHGIANVRISRDRQSGLSRGFAFVEFDSVEEAQAAYESEGREQIHFGDGQLLHMEYSHAPLNNPAGPSLAFNWICTMCQANNFARRLECHQCSTRRAANAQRVAPANEAPSHILKVSNLEPHITQDTLFDLIAAHVPLTEVRMVWDKQRAFPRGFAFAHFASIADASRAMHMLQDCNIAGQEGRLRFCFARDRYQSQQAIDPSAPVPEALQAAQAMQQYSGWAPAEFEEDKAVLKDPNGSDNATASTPAPGTAAAGSSQVPAEGGGTQAQAGFQYDSSSGYYFDASSGYYYDANSGLYFDSQAQHWMSYDDATGKYTPVPAGNDQQTYISAPFTSSAAESALAATNASVSSLYAPEATYQPPAASAAKRKGAIIGSAPKLNPEGLLAAARESKAREDEQRAKEAAAAQKAARKAKSQVVRAPAAIAAPPPVAQPALAGQQAPAAVAGPVRGVIRSSGKWGGPRNA